MSEKAAGKCEVCGRPAIVHSFTAIAGGEPEPMKSYCIDHAPPHIRERIPLTVTEQVALLRAKLALLDERMPDAEMRAMARAELEQFSADIEAGKRQLFDVS